VSTISNPALIPPGGLAGPAGPNETERATGSPSRQGGVRGGAEAPSFAEVLKEAGAGAKPGGELQFSRHALARIQRRGIDLDRATLGRLSEGVGRAAGKGSRDSLVLVDGTAFVVSVTNRTVITAVDSEHMKDNVFTNIDSAVIA
jgi:flagellar operon protein